MTHDVIVVGAGPAGLGAALAAARDGARGCVIEGGDTVGGLCVTFRRDGLAYDLGGHILFVDSDARRRWLEELLGDDALWVDRPVSRVAEGAVRPGRYLDQHVVSPDGAGPSAAAFVDAYYGGGSAVELREYLQKVDGLPLERMLADRPRRLLTEQSAPTGFWYPAGGVGQLMDTMADEVVRRGGEVRLATRVEAIEMVGGRVQGVRIFGPDGSETLRAPQVVAGVPAMALMRLLDPAPDAALIPDLPARGAAIVYLLGDADRVTDEPWIQVADPDVPFARLFEMKNWSDRLVPAGRTVLGCEVYTNPTPDDRWWRLDEDALAAACRTALIGPLGLLDPATDVRCLEVVRRPRAWSVVDLPSLPAAVGPSEYLAAIDGLALAQGGDVMRAIAAGENAVRSVA